MTISPWSPNSWENFPIRQQPQYPDEGEVKRVLQTLKGYPALVSPGEVMHLKSQLAEVARGEAFLLQGGDCAESFAEFNQENLTRYFRVMLQMTVALMYGAGKPVVKVGRIAGQFAKPRSSDNETIDGQTLPSYRGDIINSIDFNEHARNNNPQNLLNAYFQATATLNFLRVLARGGEADLRNIAHWNRDFITDASGRQDYLGLVERIEECIEFIEACRLHPGEVEQLRGADFFSSHEGLLLQYEEALTRFDDDMQKHFACSAHMLWIGDRTRALDEAHIEFFRGIANPIACKVGPTMQRDELLRLIEALNPDNDAGRLTLIARMGADKVDDILPLLVRSVRDAGANVIWSCDPMHGNTIKSDAGYKTRPFDAILRELRSFFAVHKAEGTYAGGVHFEMTGQDVTECTGGSQDILDSDLQSRYRTHCDPRLNASQSLEMVFLIAEALKE